MGVLDSSFRVRGVQALRVVDASVYPKIPGTFMLLSTYLVGEKAADLFHKATTMSSSHSRESAYADAWHDPRSIRHQLVKRNIPRKDSQIPRLHPALRGAGRGRAFPSYPGGHTRNSDCKKGNTT